MIIMESIKQAEFLFADSPMIIFVTDVHLGARNNLHAEFLKFLKLLNEKRAAGLLNNLHCFIIMGDFLDILVDSFKDLAKETLNNAVYTELNRLKNTNVEILLIFGNHEVSVFGCFKKHKERFIKQFSKHNNTLTFLKEENVAQYMILERLADNSREIRLYNEGKDIKKNKPFRKLPLPPHPQPVANSKYLICHGHWFTFWVTLMSGWLAWNPLINKPDFVKEAMNFAWNYNKGDLSEKKIDEALTAYKEGKEGQELQQINDLIAEKKSFLDMSEKEKQSFARREKLKASLVNPGVIKFLKRKKWGVDTVIFGHTHEQYITTDYKLNDRPILLANGGGWQTVGKPGFIEVLPSGEVKNFFYEIE